MLKVYCDFNDKTDDERYWILLYEHRPLKDVVNELGLVDGDRVILYQDVGDFEIEAVLMFGQTHDYFLGTEICARPDWSTLVRFPATNTAPSTGS